MKTQTTSVLSLTKNLCICWDCELIIRSYSRQKSSCQAHPFRFFPARELQDLNRKVQTPYQQLMVNRDLKIFGPF